MLLSPLICSTNNNESIEKNKTLSPKIIPSKPPILNSLEVLSRTDQSCDKADENDNLPFFQMKFSVILADFLIILKSSLYLSFTYFSSLIILMINLHFVGRCENPTLIGSIGLGNVWINSLGINTIYGLNYGFEILVSKAYGCGNYKQVGIYFKKGLILNFLILSIFSIISLFADKIFMGLGQSEEVSLNLWEYVVNTLPALYFTAFFDLRAIYFNAQGIFSPPVLIEIFTTFSYYFWCLLFFDYNILGIAYAMNISLFINFLLLEIYNWIWSPTKQSYVSWSKDVFIGLWEYMKLTGPIGMTIVLEEFSYEINSLIAGLIIPDTILAAHVSLANLGSLFYCLPEGFATAMNTYVGISLGEKKENKAKRYSILSFIGSAISMFLSYILLWIFIDSWVFLLIDNDEVINLIKGTFYLFVIVGFLDTIQMSFGAIVKITGRGNLALILYFVCLYVLANPLSYLLGITAKWGLDGIWMGIVIGLCLLAVLFFIVVFKIDWKKEVELVGPNEDVKGASGFIKNNE